MESAIIFIGIPAILTALMFQISNDDPFHIIAKLIMGVMVYFFLNGALWAIVEAGGYGWKTATTLFSIWNFALLVVIFLMWDKLKTYVLKILDEVGDKW